MVVAWGGEESREVGSGTSGGGAFPEVVPRREERGVVEEMGVDGNMGDRTIGPRAGPPRRGLDRHGCVCASAILAAALVVMTVMVVVW